MTSYTITNRISGLCLGTYEGATPQEAIEVMRRDAGYADSQAAADALGTTVEALDAELSVEEA